MSKNHQTIPQDPFADPKHPEQPRYPKYRGLRGYRVHRVSGVRLPSRAWYFICSKDGGGVNHVEGERRRREREEDNCSCGRGEVKSGGFCSIIVLVLWSAADRGWNATYCLVADSYRLRADSRAGRKAGSLDGGQIYEDRSDSEW